MLVIWDEISVKFQFGTVETKNLMHVKSIHVMHIVTNVVGKLKNGATM